MNATPRFLWTRNRALAAAALGLGVLALAGDPYTGHAVRLDSRRLATIVGGAVDHVTARELADWILQARSDYRLVDLRSDSAYAAYHIPTAENVPVARLMDAGLQRNETIVLYSDGGVHAAQAWFLLEAERFAGAKILYDGLEGWKDDVLYPAAPSDSSRESLAAFARAAEVARSFGGAPRAASSAAAGAAFALPVAGATDAGGSTIAPKAPPRPVGTPAARKKQKEGC